MIFSECSANTGGDMAAEDEVVFLFDVDNTLLNNDRVIGDLEDHLAREFGRASADRYWERTPRYRPRQ